MSAVVIGEPVHENEGQENEREVLLVLVTDTFSKEERYCLDIYDTQGNLLNKVGYRVGRVTLPIRGGDVMGDMLWPRTSDANQKYIQLIKDKVMPSKQEEDEE